MIDLTVVTTFALLLVRPGMLVMVAPPLGGTYAPAPVKEALTVVLAIVLGDKAEEAFRQSLLGSQGSLSIFFSNTLVSSIMILGLIALFWSVIQQGYTRLRGATA